MKMQKVGFLLVLTLLSLCTILVVNSLSYIIPVQNILYLTGQAHTICKGRVLEVREAEESVRKINNQMVTVKRMIAVFHVDRILKGEVDFENINIEFFSASHIPFTTLKRNEYSLVFLNEPSNSVYTFVDPYVGKMLITSSIVPLPAEGLDTSGLIEVELNASLKDDDREVVFTAVKQLGNLQRVKSTQPLKEMLQFNDKELKGTVYISLIKLNDYSMLEDAIKFLESVESDEPIKRVQGGIAHAIGEIRDQSIVSKLHQLLESENTLLRQNVAKALRSMQNSLSVGYLIRGLDDRDSEVRYHSLMGLAAIENKGGEWAPAPARHIFHQDEATYTSRWKDWWERKGKQKYSTK